MKKIRKPKRIDLGIKYKSDGTVYADFDDTKDCVIYVGGRYYDSSSQIHLSESDVHALADYLGEASCRTSLMALGKGYLSGLPRRQEVAR